MDNKTSTVHLCKNPAFQEVSFAFLYRRMKNAAFENGKYVKHSGVNVLKHFINVLNERLVRNTQINNNRLFSCL